MQLPTTPIRTLRRKQGAELKHYLVIPTALAQTVDLSDITDAEILALVQLIHDAYQEWKQQSHTSGSQTSGK